MTLRILPAAEAEAIEAAVWYDDQRAGLGDEFLNELQDVFDRVGRTPRSFPLAECYTGPDEVRRSLLKRFPYAVMFVCRPQETVVVAVSHVRRRPFYWLERLV